MVGHPEAIYVRKPSCTVMPVREWDEQHAHRQ